MARSANLNSKMKESARWQKAEQKRAKREARRKEKRNKTQCTESKESNDEFSVQR